MLICIKIIEWLMVDYKETFLEFSLVHKLTFQMKSHLLLKFFLIYLVSQTLSLQEKLAKMILKKSTSIFCITHIVHFLVFFLLELYFLCICFNYT